MTLQVREMKSAEQVREFMFAGNATLTLVSRKTGTRFTFKVNVPEDRSETSPVSHFVALMNGPDNESAFQYLGQFYGKPEAPQRYGHGRKARITEDAPSAKAFSWFAKNILAGVLPQSVEVWHEGRCGACGRKLTVPASVESGFGPECAGRLGKARPEKRTFECIPERAPWGAQ